MSDHDRLERRIRHLEDWKDRVSPMLGPSLEEFEKFDTKRKAEREAADRALHEEIHRPLPGTERVRVRAQPAAPAAAAAAGTQEQAKPDAEQERRDRVLKQLEAFRGVDGVPEISGDERTDQLEAILESAQRRKQAIDAGRTSGDTGGAGSFGARPSNTEGLNSGDTVELQRVEGAVKPNTDQPAGAVALGGANTSNETNAALQTQQDPDRAKRAQDQRVQKAVVESGALDPLKDNPENRNPNPQAPNPAGAGVKPEKPKTEG